jgi:hypothetical protein
MKSKALFIMVTCLTAALVIATGCGGTKATTSNSPTPTKSTTTTTSTTQTSTTQTTTTTTTTTTTASSTPAGGTLPAAIAITSHSAAVLTSYAGLCLMCHGPDTSNQFPLPPSWDGKKFGSLVNTGVYTVAAGSPGDHTGRVSDTCTQSGCHAAPK